MNVQKILSGAQKLHENAAKYSAGGKPATLKIRGNIYTFTFDGHNFVVTGPGLEIHGGKMVYNTRKISVARQWLREYFAD